MCRLPLLRLEWVIPNCIDLEFPLAARTVDAVWRVLVLARPTPVAAHGDVGDEEVALVIWPVGWSIAWLLLHLVVGRVVVHPEGQVTRSPGQPVVVRCLGGIADERLAGLLVVRRVVVEGVRRTVDLGGIEADVFQHVDLTVGRVRTAPSLA